MGNVNIGPLILGGIIAGIVANILGFVVDGLILASQWSASLKALGRSELTSSQIVAFNIIGLVYGLLMMWLYAAIRPRYGPGPKTAVYAGLAAWAIGALLLNVSLIGVAGLNRRNRPVRFSDSGLQRRSWSFCKTETKQGICTHFSELQ